MIRVLVVDDSAVMRAVLRDALARADDIEVVAEAADPYDAREQILRVSPDVITLDLEMPRMDGLSFLTRLMQHHPLPVVVVSSLTPARSEAALRALALGAVEVIAKPGPARSATELRESLVRAVRAAATANVRANAAANPGPVRAGSHGNGTLNGARMIALGASTGGPTAIEHVLRALPRGAPPMVIVQHMPAGFTGAFARRLNDCCELRVKEAEDGELLQAGTALIAPGGRHTVVLETKGELRAVVRDGPPVHFQRPAVDVLFHSVARAVGPKALGVLLTGMGADGASGMRALYESGAYTIAQDEESSVVFSMPATAIRLGAVSEVLPLQSISAALLDVLSGRRAAAVN